MQVAIKFIERGSKAMRGVDREVLNLRLCSLHPYVVKFKEVCALLEQCLAERPTSTKVKPSWCRIRHAAAQNKCAASHRHTDVSFE